MSIFRPLVGLIFLTQVASLSLWAEDFISAQEARQLAGVLRGWAFNANASDFARATFSDLGFFQNQLMTLTSQNGGYGSCFNRNVGGWNTSDQDCREVANHLAMIERRIIQIQGRSASAPPASRSSAGETRPVPSNADKKNAAPLINVSGQPVPNQDPSAGHVQAQLIFGGGGAKSKSSAPAKPSSSSVDTGDKSGETGSSRSGPAHGGSQAVAQTWGPNSGYRVDSSPHPPLIQEQGVNERAMQERQGQGDGEIGGEGERSSASASRRIGRRVAASDVIATKGAADSQIQRAFMSTLEIDGLQMQGNLKGKPFVEATVKIGAMEAKNGHRLAGALYAVEPKDKDGKGGVAHWIGVMPLFWNDFTHRQLRFIIRPTLSNGQERAFDVSVALIPVSSDDPVYKKAQQEQEEARQRQQAMLARQKILDQAAPVAPRDANLEELGNLLSRQGKAYGNKQVQDSELRKFLVARPSAESATSATSQTPLRFDEEGGPCHQMPDEKFRADCGLAAKGALDAMDSLWSMVKAATHQRFIDRLKFDPKKLYGKERKNAEQFQLKISELETYLVNLSASFARHADADDEKIANAQKAFSRRIEVGIVDYRKGFLSRNDAKAATGAKDLLGRIDRMIGEFDKKCPDPASENCRITRNVLMALRRVRFFLVDTETEHPISEVRAQSKQHLEPWLDILRNYVNSIDMKFSIKPEVVQRQMDEQLPKEGIAPGSHGGKARYVLETLPIFRPLNNRDEGSHSVEYLIGKTAASGSNFAPGIKISGSPFLRERDRIKSESNPRGALFRALVIFDVSKNGNMFQPAGWAMYFDSDNGIRKGNSVVTLGAGSDAVQINVEKAGDDSEGYRYLWRVTKAVPKKDAASPDVEADEDEPEDSPEDAPQADVPVPGDKHERREKAPATTVKAAPKTATPQTQTATKSQSPKAPSADKSDDSHTKSQPVAPASSGPDLKGCAARGSGCKFRGGKCMKDSPVGGWIECN